MNPAFLGWFEDVVGALRARDELPCDASASQLASTLLGLVQGFMVQRVLLGVRAEDYCEGLRGVGVHAPAVRGAVP